MKSVILLFTLSLPFSSFADCVARASRDTDGEPKYKVLSCMNASTYIDKVWKPVEGTKRNLPKKDEGQKPDDDGIPNLSLQPAPTDDDKAVEVMPVNASAKSIMRGKSEYWHFNGQCSALPLNRVVTLNLHGHCSDMGPTLYSFFGDITIQSIKKAYE
jgi:hypothetical protein